MWEVVVDMAGCNGARVERQWAREWVSDDVKNGFLRGLPMVSQWQGAKCAFGMFKMCSDVAALH